MSKHNKYVHWSLWPFLAVVTFYVIVDYIIVQAVSAIYRYVANKRGG